MPCCAIKFGCATQARLFFYCENNHQGRMWQLLFNDTPHNLQDDYNTSSIIGAKISSAIAIQDTIAENRLVSEPGWYSIHMSIEQQRGAFSIHCRDEDSRFINLCSKGKGGKALGKVSANFLLVT